MTEFDIRIPGLIGVALTHEEDGSIVIDARPTAAEKPHPGACLFCPTDTVRNGDRRSLTFRDTDWDGRHTAIRVETFQYRCKACKKTIRTPVPGCIEGHRMTERFRRLVLRMASKRPHNEVADWFGISEGTVRNLFDEYVDERLKDYSFPMPEVLGIDEKFIYSDEPLFIVGNVKDKLLLDIRYGNSPAKVAAFLRGRDDLANVKVVTMDMAGSYRKVVREVMSKDVQIVSDKWHVINLVHRALTKLRIAYSKKQQQETGKEIKGHKGLFDARYMDLKPKGRERLERLLEEHPSLYHGFWAKERFYDVYAVKTRQEALERYERWWRECVDESVRRHFRPVNRMVRSWTDGVFGYFDHPYTNAYVEGVNRYIADLNRDGRGYSFEVLRAKALLNKNLHKVVTDEPDWFRNALTTVIGGGRLEFPKHSLGVDLDALHRAIVGRTVVLRRTGAGYVEEALPGGLSSFRLDGIDDDE